MPAEASKVIHLADYRRRLSTEQTQGSAALSSDPAGVIHTAASGEPPEAEVIHNRGSSFTGDDVTGDDDAWGCGARPSDPGEAARHDEYRRDLEGTLRRWGVAGLDRVFWRFELAELARAVVCVEDQQRAGKHVRNPAGLFMFWLGKQTGRRAY